MGTIPKRNKSLAFFVILFLIISCGDKIIFTKYESLENASWKAKNNISFEFDIIDTISPKNLFVNIRNNKDYPFSNLYLITELNFPNGDIITDTLQYKMANEMGQFLGKGFTDIKENKLFYKEEKVFPVSGKHVLNIRHAMRKNGEINIISSLEGIQDVGFSIEKTK